MNERDIKQKMEFIRLYKKATDCAGFSVFKNISSIRISFSIYYENYRTLKKSFETYYSDENLITQNSVKRWRKQRIIIKDFHNLVASAQSYVDYIKTSKNQVLLSEIIQHQLDKQIFKSPQYQFIRALRNFLIHHQILPLISIKSLMRGENGVNKSLRFESIDRQIFEDYLNERIKDPKKTQDRAAKAFLDSKIDKVNLNEIVEESMNLFRSFHHWLVIQIVNENYNSLHDFSKNVSENHKFALKFKLNKSIPITFSQEKYLNYLLRKAKG